MEEAKSSGLIVDDEPGSQAASATGLQNHEDSGKGAPLPQIDGENDETKNDNDESKQLAQTLEPAFGADGQSYSDR